MSQSRYRPGDHESNYSDIVRADLMSGEMTIEADGDFDEGPIDVDDEDLNAAFEATHGAMFQVIDEVGEASSDRSYERSKESNRDKKYVIPKLKRSENDGSGEEGSRDWRRSDRDRQRDHPPSRRDRGDRDSGKRDSREQDFRRRDRGGESGDRDHAGRREKETRERDSRRREWDDSRDGREEDRGRRHGDPKREPQNGQSSERTQAEKPSAEPRQSLFESFTKEGLIGEMHTMSPEQPANNREAGMEDGSRVTPMEQAAGKDSHVGEEDTALEIPMGRDSLVFVRDCHSWQIRLHPVTKQDVTRAEFTAIWALADSSSLTWSDINDFGGVAEFLLKDKDNIQKFMRKILWFNFKSELLTVEITERDRSSFSEQDANGKMDVITNQITFKFHNKRARQMIKTYYPTPQGEVTERSVYVNNINSGKAVYLLRAVFPCAAKISVARENNETSSAVVGTASAEEALHYLVVYQQIAVNNSDVLMSTGKTEWEDAKRNFEEKASKTEEAEKSGKPTSTTAKIPEESPSGKGTTPTATNNQNRTAGKRPASATDRGDPAKKSRPTSSSSRGRGGSSSRGGRGGRSGNRAKAPAGPNKGKTLLPDPTRRPPPPPGGLGDGLLPLPVAPPPLSPDGLLPPPDRYPAPVDRYPPPPPERYQPPSLLGMPVNPTPAGVIEGQLLGPPEPDYRTLELKEIRQELEERVMETRAQLESHLSKLDQTYRSALAPKPRPPPVDYLEEEERSRAPPPRRPLLSSEGRAPPVPPERSDWRKEDAEYRRPAASRPLPPPPHRPLPPPTATREREYEAPPPPAAYSRPPRREEDYPEVRAARPYLLDAPPSSRAEVSEEKDRRGVYEYEHALRRPRVEDDPPPRLEERRPLLSRTPALVERERLPPARDYPEERPYSSRDRYDYEAPETRRAPGYAAYEEETRRAAAPRYREDYAERRY